MPGAARELPGGCGGSRRDFVTPTLPPEPHGLCTPSAPRAPVPGGGLDLPLLERPAPGSVRRGWRDPERASQSAGRLGRCGTGEGLGTELGEARAESRRGRTFPRLIVGLSHGVHVRALPREGKECLGNQPCSGEKVYPEEGAATEKMGGWRPRREDPTTPCQRG